MNITDRHLSDMQVLRKFEESPDSINPMYLFWSFYRPDQDDDSEGTSHNPVLAQLDSELDGEALERLQILYDRHRPHYPPDNDDSAIRHFILNYDYQENPDGMAFPDDLKDALIFLHVAAIRAHLLCRTEGLSEEVRDCLDEVERTFIRLRLAGFVPEDRINPYMRLLDEEPNLEGLGIFLSILAVTAISYVSLSRTSRIEGRYSDALHYLAQAGHLYECARPTPLGTNDMWPLGSSWQHPEYTGATLMEDCLTGIRIPLDDFSDTFDLIRQSPSAVDDWSGIVTDCRTLAGHTYCWRFPELEEDARLHWDEGEGLEELRALHVFLARITDEDGGSVRWGEFWHGAKAWASAQLSPSDYREMRRRDEQDASETRMEKYFFGKYWSRLPERARERIIDADILWTSSQRVNREALLNELQRATEEMCYAFIWHPLTEEAIASDGLLTEIESRMAADKRHHPGVGDFIRISERRFFHEFLERRKLDESEIQFLSEDLSVAMRQLRPARNSAEHDMGRTIPEQQIEELYSKFLGIGRSGILPGLVRIGGKLRVSRRSR